MSKAYSRSLLPQERVQEYADVSLDTRAQIP
jgi:hypothetical protein